MTRLIGRVAEKGILEEALRSSESEMVAVIGRRRIGKTYLVQTVYGDSILFELTGVQNATKDQQLQNFSNQLQLLAKEKVEKPKDWLDAFFLLRIHLE